jgi:hypothetical protein
MTTRTLYAKLKKPMQRTVHNVLLPKRSLCVLTEPEVKNRGSTQSKQGKFTAACHRVQASEMLLSAASTEDLHLDTAHEQERENSSTRVGGKSFSARAVEVANLLILVRPVAASDLPSERLDYLHQHASLGRLSSSMHLHAQSSI